MDTVVVTGAGGWIGRRIVAALAGRGFEVVGIDLPGVGTPSEVTYRVEGDIADPGALAQVQGASYIVHAAVATDPSAYVAGTPAFRTNVEGTYQVFEAARRLHVSRGVLLSSAPVHVSPWPDDDPVSWRSSPGDDHLYDLTKRLQEVIAADYQETFGFPSIVLRLGHIVDSRAGVDPEGHPLEELEYCRGGWVCCHDVARACIAALDASLDRFETLSVVGQSPGYERFDTARTEQVLAFTVRERFAPD